MNPAPSYRILLTGIDGADHLCHALTSDRAGLDVEIIEPDAATIPAENFDASRSVDVFVIGPYLAGPLTRADQLRQLVPRAQVVFLLATGKIERFRTSLPFVPHLSDAWTAPLDAPPEATKSVILEAAQTARSRHGLLSVFDRINAQLASGRPTAEVRRRQRQIMLSEKYLATILKQAPDAIFALNLNCMVIATNEAANRLFGLSTDDAVGRPAFSFSHQTSTKKSARSSSVGAQAKRSLGTRQSSCQQARRQPMLNSGWHPYETKTVRSLDWP